MFTTKRTYKPYTRMWVYGFNVDRQTIDQNLKAVKDAGIGGIELQVLYPVAMKGNIDFFSPTFFEYLNYMVEQCAKLDLDLDLTLGSGWPFGAPFITKEMSPDILIPYQQDIIGPTTYSFDFTCILSGKIVKAILAEVVDGKIVQDSLEDVTKYVKKTYISVWPWGQEVKDMPVKKGIHRLYLFVSNEYRQRVGKAAPNMDGYAMDHCRQDVTDLYLDQLGNTLLDNIDASKIRSVFCDSIELTGSNWTKYLAQEFQQRRGYDLVKYMPVLWQDIENISPYIRADYYRTYGELTNENFFARIKDWAASKNVQFRLQAHGTWADIIDAYSASHIPEGETFGGGDFLEVNINHRRLAVSAHMAIQTDIVSNETYTWLRKPRFLVTLEMMKRATDACFVDGINHIINHGYSFYKNETFENLFYASSVISPHNTWWEYYPQLSSYIENTTKYLQNSRIKSRVAMLVPTTEIWSKNIMAELHMSLKVENHISKEFANELAKAGYWFSFVNDRKVQENTHKLILDNNEMEVLIVPNMECINLDTLKTIEKLADNTKIIFMDCMPKHTDTFVNYEQNDQELVKIVNQLQNHKNVVMLNRDEVVAHVQKVLAPDIIITNNETIGYIIKENEEGLKYIFIANIEDQPKQTTITYPFKNNVKLYDPTTDSYLTDYQQKGDTIDIQLQANQSIILQECLEETIIIENNLEKTKQLSIKHWQLDIQEESIQMEVATTWEQFEKHAYFSGNATYSSMFEGQECEQAMLSIEELYEVCEVTLNGQHCGVIWKKPYQIDVSKYIKPGANKLEIKATNLLFNASLAFEAQMPQGVVSQDWPYLNIVVEQQRKDKVDTFREREENLGLQKSGISGEVSITFHN